MDKAMVCLPRTSGQLAAVAHRLGDRHIVPHRKPFSNPNTG
jgi:urease accessory protein UreE